MVALSALKPDLVFLDIDMPECDGFEMLERIGPCPAFAIVFDSAHHQFALRAFEVGALDYMLKPFDDQRFGRVLERAKERLRVAGETRHFMVRNGNMLELVNFADIDWSTPVTITRHFMQDKSLQIRSPTRLSLSRTPRRICR